MLLAAAVLGLVLVHKKGGSEPILSVCCEVCFQFPMLTGLRRGWVGPLIAGETAGCWRLVADCAPKKTLWGALTVIVFGCSLGVAKRLRITNRARKPPTC